MFMHPTFGGLAAIAQGDFRMFSYDVILMKWLEHYGVSARI